MRIISEEKLNTNYLRFVKALERFNCYSEKLMEEYGERIKEAPYFMSESYGGCYKGALIDVTLNILCKIGVLLNRNVLGMDENGNIRFNNLCVNENMLMRVLLLTNISKAVMFVVNSNDWKRNNGFPYEFNQYLDSNLKMGERCVYMCQKYGIPLAEEEFEAILSSDKDDDYGDRFKSPICAIVNSARTLTAVELRQQYIQSTRPVAKEE